MKSVPAHRFLFLGLVSFAPAACGGGGSSASNGPSVGMNPNPHQTGDATSGRDVFRFETFGNEGFWTDAVKLPQGIVAAGITPIDALEVGLMVDVDALSPAQQAAIHAELQTDLSPANAPLLNDPATTVLLVNANAVIGFSAIDTTGDGTTDVLAGDKVGPTCALCHTITDGSEFSMPGGGSIGHRLDGRANHDLDFGKILSLAQNTRALYPMAQLALTANGGTSLGRAAAGLTETSTEAEFDAYFSNPANYPVGMFDDTLDGNGDPMHNTPLFRTDLAAPWGSAGEISRLDNFSNLVYTALLDPTTITTPGGRAFITKLGGGAAGNEIVDDYIAVLTATGVTGYPFVDATAVATAGTEEAPLGLRVNNTKLLDLNAYLDSLPGPRGVDGDPALIASGLDRFRHDCTNCHNRDQSRFVPPFIVDMERIWPGDDPDTLLAARQEPLNPILNSPGTFDDKMAVVNASLRGLERGIALPLLLDLARKPVFLHDNSVSTLDELLDPARGGQAPHPFYLADPQQRAAMVAFLRSLDTEN